MVRCILARWFGELKLEDQGWPGLEVQLNGPLAPGNMEAAKENLRIMGWGFVYLKWLYGVLKSFHT